MINFKGNPVYIKSEKSFSYQPWNNCNYSLMIGSGYNSLDVNLDKMKVVHLSGLNPMETWQKGKVSVPTSKSGILMLKKESEFLPGTGMTYAEGWTTTFDKVTGWIHIGKTLSISQCNCVEFAANTIAAVHRGNLVAILIKPVFKTM